MIRYPPHSMRTTITPMPIHSKGNHQPPVSHRKKPAIISQATTSPGLRFLPNQDGSFSIASSFASQIDSMIAKIIPTMATVARPRYTNFVSLSNSSHQGLLIHRFNLDCMPSPSLLRGAIWGVYGRCAKLLSHL
jgi:hypothetical protein